MSGRAENVHRKKIGTIIKVAVFVLLSVVIVGALYLHSQPNTYDLAPGDVATEDIFSTRAIPDQRATALAAEQAALQTADVYVRSEGISEDVLATLTEAYERIDATRAELYPGTVEVFDAMLALLDDEAELPETPEESEPEADDPEETEATGEEDEDAIPDVDIPQADGAQLALGEIADRLFFRESLGSDAIRAKVRELDSDRLLSTLPDDTLTQLLSFQPSIYYSQRLHSNSLAEIIMANRMDSADLNQSITSLSASVQEQSDYYSFEFATIPTILRTYLRPNMVYDESATAAAREAARRQILADPIMLASGSRIIAAGETITTTQYNLLRDLDLVDTNEIDYLYLAGLVLMYLIVSFLLFLYIYRYERKSLQTTADLVVLVISILMVFFVSMYVTSINTLLPPIYFIAVIGAAYFGFRTSMILSLYSLILVYPMSAGDTKFLVVAVLTSFLIALVMAQQARRSSYAPTILAATLGSFITATAFGLVAGDNLNRIFTDAGMMAISAFGSVIAAVGVMPIFEIFLSSVSPVKLITLAQPSQPLLQRLFIEAPGTYQHSMMVANLAEAAAEQVGVNALLVRVGAYYHDIGKLENPLMFTENQKGYNPHDYLPPEESARVIMRHVSSGLKTAQRHRLPHSIQDMITEHHGTSLLKHFYDRGKRIAESEGLPPPKPSDFRYPWRKPQSKETAILMLADTMEAAMKSTGISNVEDAEVLVRRLVKGKNDEDQLVESGLSFNEVETIIKAFLQVYAGQFHERVKYPDANPSTQTSV